jgi:hypothetical protein
MWNNLARACITGTQNRPWKGYAEDFGRPFIEVSFVLPNSQTSVRNKKPNWTRARTPVCPHHRNAGVLSVLLFTLVRVYGPVL